MSRSLTKNSLIRITSVLIGIVILGSACAQSSPTQTDVPASASDTTLGSEVASNTGEPSEEDGTTSIESATSVLDREANPLPVTFTIESAASATTEMGPEGGEVTTVSADGTRYTLSVPEGALLGVETITITPITLDESPFEDAAVFGVSMEPDGLIFLQAATLEISGRSFEQSTSVGFSSDRGGGDFGAQLAVIGDTATLQIAHFSDGGVFQAERAEIDRIFDGYAPRSREGRYLQEIAVINRRVEELNARGIALVSVLESWFGAIRADAASANDAATVEQLLGEFNLARAIVEQLPYDDGGEAIGESVDRAMALAGLALQEAAVRLFDQENLRCIQDRDPDAMFAMLKWALVYAWIGDGFTEDTSRLDELLGAIKQCARFRVEFKSSAAFEFSSEVSASVPLEFPSRGAEFSLDRGDMSYPTVQGTLTGTAEAGSLSCTTQAPIDVELKVFFNPVFGRLSETRIQGAIVSIRPYENTNWVCGGTNIQQSLWLPWFVGAFSMSPAGNGFYEFETERSSKVGVWAESNLAGSSQGVIVTVEVKLIHDPQLP